MKTVMNWRGNKKIDRGKRVREKPKIRWHHLGLKDPAEDSQTPSMAEIRRQVVTLSSRGLGQVVRSRPVAQSGPATGPNTHGEPVRAKRRGVTQ